MSLVATKNESLRRSAGWLYFCPSGDVAQLGERGVRNAEVEGSIPFVSTTNTPGRRLFVGLVFSHGLAFRADVTFLSHLRRDNAPLPFPERAVTVQSEGETWIMEQLGEKQDFEAEQSPRHPP